MFPEVPRWSACPLTRRRVEGIFPIRIASKIMKHTLGKFWFRISWRCPLMRRDGGSIIGWY